MCENMAWPDAGLAIRYPLTQYTLTNTELMHAHMNIVLLPCRLNVFFFLLYSMAQCPVFGLSEICARLNDYV